jgi:hypothetical protein
MLEYESGIIRSVKDIQTARFRKFRQKLIYPFVSKIKKILLVFERIPVCFFHVVWRVDDRQVNRIVFNILEEFDCIRMVNFVD